MTPPRLATRALAMRYGSRPVFEDVSLSLVAGQSLGVLGRNGAGKTTLLRAMVGLIAPVAGEVRIDGRRPPAALERTPVAYFAGDATLPGSVRAVSWGRLGTGDLVMPDRRPIRALSRGTRQLLGLRTILGRQPLGLIVLDEPWEGLDADGARWLSAMLELKRDRGAAVVLSAQRLSDLTNLCDNYLALEEGRATLLRAQDVTPVGAPTADALSSALDRAVSRARQTMWVPIG